MRLLAEYCPLILLLLLAGCTPPTPVITPDQALKPFSLTDTHARSGKKFFIDSEKSVLRIFVFRGGLLAALGHNHVIRSQDIQGMVFVADDFADSGIHIQFPVQTLVIDDPEDRRIAAVNMDADFSTVPSSNDISGTGKNMLGDQLLDSAYYPDIRIQSLKVSGSIHELQLLLRIYVKESSTDLSVPLKVNMTAETLHVYGKMDLMLTDLGLTPFSILAGAMTVQNNINLQFDFFAAQEQ